MRFASAVLATVLPGVAMAGGPLIIGGDGDPIVWPQGAVIQYNTDNGPLSASVNQTAAQARVRAMFDVWENVASANIAYNRLGFIQAVPGFSDGDVSGATEYDAVEGSCLAGDQSPIVYDANGSIFIALGIDETSVIGFAGPCAFNVGGEIVSGQAVMNGLFQDGQATPVPDLSTAEFDATFIHEFGHFSGLDHSQINVECGFAPCSVDDLDGLPTMFPFLVSDEQGTLSIDDIAWISKLYPAGGGGGFGATHGHVSGTIFFSDGESHAQLVNVVARRVATGGAPDESRTTAASNVSGYRFRFFHGNPITNPQPSIFGSTAPALIGFYEIPLPPGSYTLEVESIDPAFVGGSSVGGPVQIDMPGTAPAPIGPVSVTAGATSAGHDFTLIGTEPRFDQFEGP